MKSAIVSGADGFIGTKLLQLLSDKKVETWGLVLPESPHKKTLEKLPFINIIECTLDDIPVAVIPKHVDTFYHLAWQGVSPNDRKNLDIQFKNLEYGLSCIRFAADACVKKTIFPGSQGEYEYFGEPINERAVPSTHSAYGSAKLATRYLCHQYAKDLGVDFIYAVISSIYSEDRLDDSIITYAIGKLLRAEKPSFTKSEQMWDFVHVHDVIRALFLVGERGKPNSFYAIGSGNSWPLSRYIAIIHDLIDPSLPLGIGELPYPEGRVPSSRFDLSSVQRDTGYVPEISFEVEIKKMIDKLRERGKDGSEPAAKSALDLLKNAKRSQGSERG